MKKVWAVLLSGFILSTIAGCGEAVSASEENPETSAAYTEYNTNEIEQTEWKDSLSENGKAGKYTLLFIYDNETADSKSMKENMKILADNMSDQFVFVEVDYIKSKISLLHYLNTTGIYKLPLALSIAPSGLICGGFNTECTEEELKSTITTGTMEKVLLSLQKGEITLITIHNGQNEKINELDKMILKEIEPYGGCVVSYYLDSTNADDMTFIKNLPETEGDMTVLVTVPPGSIAAMLTDDEITSENISEAILFASTGGGCC